MRELVPYLRDLGVSHLYLSPSLQARSGSTHGYDVVDPTRVSDALGGEEALRALAAAGLGIVLDIVPNHMGTGDENRWWPDPGRSSTSTPRPAATGASSTSTTSPPCAMERQEVFDLLHGKVLELVARGRRRRAARRPPRRPRRPRRLPAAAARRRRARTCGSRRSSHPGEPLRDWPVDGTVGYEFLNDVAGAVRRPGRRGGR